MTTLGEYGLDCTDGPDAEPIRSAETSADDERPGTKEWLKETAVREKPKAKTRVAKLQTETVLDARGFMGVIKRMGIDPEVEV